MARLGLGCMRLSTDPDRDDERAAATVTAALDAGVSWLDTARSYGRDASDLGHNERLIAAALRSRAEAGVGSAVRVVTKCGMARPDGRWEVDGRASSILADARASVVDLGRAPDVLLLHAPDPDVTLATSVRALLRAQAEGLTHAIGLSNVTRGQLDALEREPSLRSSGAPFALGAVEVALGAYDDAAARGGVVAWCKERSVPVLAHSPLGGVARAGRLQRDPVLRAIAERRGVTAAQVVLAYLLAVDALIVPLPGARRAETARSALAAEQVELDEADLSALDARFPGLAMVRRPPRAPSSGTATAEVVVVMGIAGSGKTRLARSYVERGYERLNRDDLGGTLGGIARRLEALLAGGATRIVLDNTYVTRASRSEVIRVATCASAIVRCVHVDIDPGDARVNVATRMLERHDALLGGVELAKQAKLDPNLFAPNALFRMERELERPSPEEGFSSIDVVPFTREYPPAGARGVAIALDLVIEDREPLALRGAAERVAALGPRDGPILLFGWRPATDASWRARAGELAASLFPGRPIEVGICTHAAGPPVCWCRPPLPGLWLAFARRHGVDPRTSVMIVSSLGPHRTMAKNLGLEALAVIPPP